MKRLFYELCNRYRLHHETNKSLLEWIGVVGITAFPALYLVRLTGKLPPRYDDLPFRLVAIALCLLLALRRWWPERLRRYYLPYSYLTVFYSLAFLLPFTLLQNKAAANSVVNMVIGAVLIILLTDWRNTILTLVAGYCTALGVYWLTHPQPELPLEFFYWWIPLCAVLVAGGSISKYVERRAELERMRLVYSGLAGSIAHEVRNPLMQLRYVLDMLAAGLPPSRPGEGILLSAQQMAELVRAIGQGQDSVTRGLQAISVTLHQLSPSALDTTSFRFLSAGHSVRKAVSEFAYENEAQRARVLVDEGSDFTFKGDETVFVLVLLNLIKNALYYLPTHPNACITITVDGSSGPRVTVRDTGPGIAPDRLDRLFDEFQTSGKAEGTGLGLAFCKRAMQAFGGDIRCRSQLGEYTEFTLDFPPVAEEQVQAHQEKMVRQAHAQLAGKSILVVDDEELMRKSARRKLGAMGCVIDEAQDGVQALQALRERPYDLILMDINMPVLDGFSTTQQIRQGAVPGREQTPVLGFSSSLASVAGVRGRQTGMSGFLSKDIDPLELAQTLAQILGSAGATAAATDDVLAGRTVLLVEDNAFNRAALKARLQALNLQVIEAAHGREALQVLAAGARPAVILMDLEMPGLNGIETTRALRGLAGTRRHTPVIAITGHSLPQHVADAKAAGIDGFLTKPIEPDALRSELTRVLRNPLAPAPGRGELDGTELPVEGGPPLLNTSRIDEFRRLGILDSVVPGCLSEIRRFIGRLAQCLASHDLSGALPTLHSLLGVSGEAGAQALYEAIRHCHTAVTQGQWPPEAGWLDDLQQLAVRTEEAMFDRYAISCAQPSA